MKPTQSEIDRLVALAASQPELRLAVVGSEGDDVYDMDAYKNGVIKMIAYRRVVWMAGAHLGEAHHADCHAALADYVKAQGEEHK